VTRERRGRSTDIEVAAALASLDQEARPLPASSWPGELSDVDQAGVYAWWVSAAGGSQLASGLEDEVRPGRIYAGQTGATAWPSGKVRSTTLAGRIGGNHLRGRIRGSTFRLTLAACLRVPLDLEPVGPKLLAPESERRLSEWIREHLPVVVHPFDNRDAPADLEDEVLARLDPPLNLEGMPSTPLRVRLASLRAELAGSPVAAARPVSASSRSTDDRSGEPASRRPRTTGRVTLHDELVEILSDRDNRWTTTEELAKLVNERGRYRKRDGTPVTGFQVHGRTKNYPHLFERDGSRVRLRT
jgi:hypothetical protein